MVREEARNDLHMSKVMLLVPENYLESKMKRVKGLSG